MAQAQAQPGAVPVPAAPTLVAAAAAAVPAVAAYLASEKYTALMAFPSLE